MKKLADQITAVVSGAIVLFGLVLFLPQVAGVFAIGNLTLADLGLFLLVAWGGGYSIEAIGLVIEQLFWAPFGGPPASWPVKGKRQVLSRGQLDVVAAKVNERLGVECRDIRTLSDEQWSAVYQRIYLAAARAGNPELISHHNIYRLSRALAASFLILTVIVLLGDSYYVGGWLPATLLLAGANLYRMYVSGVKLVESALLHFVEPRHVARDDGAGAATDEARVERAEASILV